MASFPGPGGWSEQRFTSSRPLTRKNLRAVIDDAASRELYVDTLGLPLGSQGGDYHHSEQVEGCRSFGI